MASHTHDPRLFAHVEFVLKRQVEIASQEHYRAKFDFWQMSSVPGRAEEHQLSEAGRKCAVKQNALSRALRRLDDFIVKGTIPEDVRRAQHPGQGARDPSFA